MPLDHDIDLLFEDWRRHCVADALDLVDRVLFSGSAATQPGLRPAWQDALHRALSQPGPPALESRPAQLPLDTLSGVTLLSDDEISQSILSSRAVQALQHEAEWSLRDLAARTLVWWRHAELAGFGSALLLEPARLAETLEQALDASVPFAPRRLDLLRELHAPLVREAAALYRRHLDWLDDHGVGGGTPRSAARLPGHAPAPGAAAPAGLGAVAPHRLPALFERLEQQAGLGPGMRHVMQTVSAMAQASVAQDPGVLVSTAHPLWRLVDRLAALAQLDTAGQAPGRADLASRLAPLVDAMRRAPQPMQARHYEQALYHLERLASEALPAPAAPQPAQLESALQAAELQPLLRAQIADRLRRDAVHPAVAQFLLGDWSRVLARASAVDGVDAPRTQRWTALIEDLARAAAATRRQPPSPAALDCLLLEAGDGLRSLGESPARVAQQVQALLEALRPATTVPATAVATVPLALPGQAPVDAPDAGPDTLPAEALVAAARPGGSVDVQASDWMHHADLSTVPMAMVDEPDSPAWRDRAQWLAGLAAGDLCRACLQGRWTAVRLDWISDNGQFYAFSRRAAPPFCTSRRVLERMRGEGLITTIPPGQWLQAAADSLPEGDA